MISLISDFLFNLFGSGDRCYRCGRRLKIITTNHEIKDYCPNGHIEYYYTLNNTLFMIKYNIGEYILIHSTRVNYINVFKYKAVNWSERLFKMPYFDVEKYTQEQVIKKIKMHLVFG